MHRLETAAAALLLVAACGGPPQATLQPNVRDDCAFAPADIECWRADSGAVHYDIWLVDPDGANLRRATPEYGQFVAWSPHSRYLLVSGYALYAFAPIVRAALSSARTGSIARWAASPTRPVVRPRNQSAASRPAQSSTRIAIERVPPARCALAVLHLEVRLALVDALERPAAVGLPVPFDDVDRLDDALVRGNAGIAQVVEAAQDVVVVPVREREMEPVGIDDLATRLPAEQAVARACIPRRAGVPPRTPAEPPTARSYASSPSSTLIVVPNEDTVAPFSDLAVPAAVRELLAEEPLHERRHVHAEVRAGRDGVAVDARLHLALEEPVVRPGALEVRIPPGDVRAARARRPAGPARSRARARNAGATPGRGTCPSSHWTTAGPPTARQAPGARAAARPSPGSRPEPLRGDDLRRLVGQVAHDLPADRGIGIEQPVDDVHGDLRRISLSSESSMSPRSHVQVRCGNTDWA